MTINWPNSIHTDGSINYVSNPNAEDIKLFQDILIKDGYTLENNGEFDTKTSETIKQYQIKNGLDTTGEIDIETMNQLADTYKSQ
jgi:peptidoglycan hydrolase-like protein with peptidoglycan-binding domain